jgi:hypothetical protein
MKRCILVLLLSLQAILPALAQASPQEVVNSFYKDYTYAMESTPRQWMETLMGRQTANMEKPLLDGLLRLAAGDPNKGEPFLDFDPFSNSQTGLDSYTVGEPTYKQGLAYVPVSMRLSREPGPERMRLRFVLRDQGQGWKVANVAYPAENGMAAWDLKGYLNDGLQP